MWMALFHCKDRYSFTDALDENDVVPHGLRSSLCTSLVAYVENWSTFCLCHRCELYFLYGVFLAPLTAALTTAKHREWGHNNVEGSTPDGH